MELFDVVAENGKVCNDNFPIEVDGAVGGFLSHPLVCGGRDSDDSYTDQCYLIGDNDPVAVTMTEKRGYAASVVWANSFLFITGGYDGHRYLSSSEYVWSNGTSTPGNDMPLPIGLHSMVAINDSTIMVIGGYNGGHLDNTYYYNPMDDKSTNWIDGPSLLEARHRHASAILGHHIITGGGVNSNYALSSVEILDLQSFPHQWTQGKLIMFCYV